MTPWGEASLPLGEKHPHFVGLRAWVLFGCGDFLLVFFLVCFLIFPFSSALPGITSTRGLRAGRVQASNGISPKFRAPLTPRGGGTAVAPSRIPPGPGVTLGDPDPLPVTIAGSAPSLSLRRPPWMLGRPGMAEGWPSLRAAEARGQEGGMGDSSNLDDSLTSLQWLQEFSIINANVGKSSSCPSGPDPHDYHRIPGFAAPCSPLAADPACMGMPHTPGKPTSSSTSRTAHPAVGVQPPAEDIDYKSNPHVKPPYSYATLICMAMEASKKTKITLSAIYKWITDNFCYFQHADPTWQVGALGWACRPPTCEGCRVCGGDNPRCKGEFAPGEAVDSSGVPRDGETPNSGPVLGEGGRMERRSFGLGHTGMMQPRGRQREGAITGESPGPF